MFFRLPFKRGGGRSVMHVVAYSEMGSNIEYIFWRKRVALIDYTRSALFRIAPGKQWRRLSMTVSL